MPMYTLKLRANAFFRDTGTEPAQRFLADTMFGSELLEGGSARHIL